MSYNIGQWRRTQRPVDDYMEKYTAGTHYQTISSYLTKIDTVTFNDFAIEMINGNTLSNQYSYHLKFSLGVPDKEPRNQKITIKLKNDNSETVQIIKTVTTSNEVLITPIAEFKYIVFELERVAQDYTYNNGNGVYGRKINVTITSFGLIKNILGVGFMNLNQPLTKIGVQGPKGLVMCINGEEIKIGNSGIYEIDNGMKIYYFGVVLKKHGYGDYLPYTDGTQYFILDYQYEAKGE